MSRPWKEDEGKSLQDKSNTHGSSRAANAFARRIRELARKIPRDMLLEEHEPAALDTPGSESQPRDNNELLTNCQAKPRQENKP